MDNKKKLWIVTELFYPDETSSGYYITEIANYLANYKEVNIICGHATYDSNFNLTSQTKKLSPNIILHRVKASSLDKNKLSSRFFRLLNITLTFTYQLFVKVKNGDDVWLVTNPAFLLPFAAFLSQVKGFQLRILVHDVFPENLIPINLSNPQNITYRLVKYVFNRAYSSVSQIVVCGRDMKLLFEQKIGSDKSDKIVVIENWADIDSILPTPQQKRDIYQDQNLKDKIIFQFAGNIGRLQGLEELLIIIKQCSNPAIHFVFIGDGALKNTLISKTKNMSNITFLPSFNRNEQNTFLNACDVGIVSLYDTMLGLGVPSKSYNIMAAGKPILFLGNKKSEISMMINEYSIGWQFELAKHQDIINFLNNFDIILMKEKGINARLAAENLYSKKHILEKYRHLIQI